MRISDWRSDVCSSDLPDRSVCRERRRQECAALLELLLDDRHAVAGDLLQRLVGAILGITLVGRPVALLHLRGLGEIKIVERTSRRVAKQLEQRGALGRQTSWRPGNQIGRASGRGRGRTYVWDSEVVDAFKKK